MRLLVIDDRGEVARALEAAFGTGLKACFARSGEEGVALFNSRGADVVIAGSGPPGAGEFDSLERIRAADPAACVIVVAETREMDSVVGAIRRGAFDCISRPVDPGELEGSLKKAFRNIGLHARLKDIAAARNTPGKETIVGKSRAMEEIFKVIGAASQGKVTVLVQGESGTGKELIARAIHRASRERDRPFMPINCSALVETLLESELFGHEKGAFTGAVFRKEGKFEAANGGTVFLDEIGEMSQPLQIKLLRVLQERCFERVGGSETIRTDVRVIAATNRDLEKLTGRGAFREDLYYRLKVVTIDIPPLRERPEDIPLLVSYLLEKANRELGRSVRKVPGSVMSVLSRYPWPGNVRELENVITRGVLLAKGDVLLDVYLPGPVRGAGEPERPRWGPAPLDDVERAHILRTLEYAGWNRSRAALLLGTTLPRLRRKMKKWGLAPAPK